MINPSCNKTYDLAHWLKQAGLVNDTWDADQNTEVLPIIVASSRGLAICCEWLLTRFEEVELANTNLP